MEPVYFEDFAVGQRFESGEARLSAEDIIAFGRQYAPLPYHTDPEAAKESAFGGLVATGYQTLAIMFRLVVETGLLATSMGSPGLDNIRWIRPVRPGDSLRVVMEVTAVNPASANQKRDMVHVRYSVLNGAGHTVMTVNSRHFVRRKLQTP